MIVRNNKINSEITGFLHPDTYLNKILLGFSDGRIELWNIRTKYVKITSSYFNNLFRSLIFEFPSFHSAIDLMIQCPAVDIVTVVLRSGEVVLLNIKSGEIVMRLMHKERIISACFIKGTGNKL